MDTTRRHKVLVAGASGTIGLAVAHALLAEGHHVVCIMRHSGSGEKAAADLGEAGAEIVFADMGVQAEIEKGFHDRNIDTVVSCVASRSGSPKDAEAVDCDANIALLDAAEAAGGEHFILLSAICVQKPRLAFQRAKIVFESALRSSTLDYTIVRPTAFFKSLSGQVDRVRAGKPFLLFDDGELTRCKPISDADLARFIADCVTDPERRNQVLPIGGPGPAISLREQGELLFEVAGKEPRFRSISPRLFTLASKVLSIGAGFSGWLAEKAEYARIAHYYATESMLVLDPETGEYDADATPEFGTETLRNHYARLLADKAGAA